MAKRKQIATSIPTIKRSESTQTMRLERILRQVGRDGDAVRAIDLRFRDQVVLTKGVRG